MAQDEPAKAGPRGPADPCSVSSSPQELNWGPSFCTCPPGWVIPCSQSLLHEPLAVTSDLTTLRSCPLSWVFESLMCHQECWELPSLAMGAQPVSSASLPISLCPSCQAPSGLGPSRSGAHLSASWPRRKCGPSRLIPQCHGVWF